MLTPRKRAFANRYPLTLDGTKTAIDVGYSAKTAAAAASRLLRDVNVRALIDEKTKKRELEAEVDATWLLKDLSAQANADIADLYEKSGEIRPVHDWPMVWRTGLVADIQTSQALDGDSPVKITRIKLADRIKVRELLGRHVTIQAWRDRKEVTGLNGAPIEISLSTTSPDIAYRQLVDGARVIDGEFTVVEGG